MDLLADSVAAVVEGGEEALPEHLRLDAPLHQLQDQVLGLLAHAVLRIAYQTNKKKRNNKKTVQVKLPSTVVVTDAQWR